MVLSHYDLGAIEAIKEFRRGSRKSPKVVLRTDQGKFLLKRRAAGKNDPYKVAFCHHLQLYLANKHFPLPHLIGTRKNNNSMLQFRSATYELFEYIPGSSYNHSLEATADAGRILALFHKLLADYQPQYEPPQGSYHKAQSVVRSFEALPHTLAKVGSDGTTIRNKIDQLNRFLHDSYHDAAALVNEAGLAAWPMQFVHCDWHPGNILFRGPQVVAVIDYDAARLQQRILDVANGALQFSMVAGGQDPAEWPDYVDVSRYKRFVRAYESDPTCVLSHAEIRIIPLLMIEALIAECVIPIAATGSFARKDGVAFLHMVKSKVGWLRDHTDELIRMLED